MTFCVTNPVLYKDVYIYTSLYKPNDIHTLYKPNNAVVSEFLAERLLTHNGMASISPRDEIFVEKFQTSHPGIFTPGYNIHPGM